MKYHRKTVENCQTDFFWKSRGIVKYTKFRSKILFWMRGFIWRQMCAFTSRRMCGQIVRMSRLFWIWFQEFPGIPNFQMSRFSDFHVFLEHLGTPRFFRTSRFSRISWFSGFSGYPWLFRMCVCIWSGMCGQWFWYDVVSMDFKLILMGLDTILNVGCFMILNVGFVWFWMWALIRLRMWEIIWLRMWAFTWLQV